LVYLRKGPGKVLVLGVVEVKSGNFRLLAKERGSVYGQVERTLARLESGRITIEGEKFDLGGVELLADHGRRTRWLVALPPKSASPTQLANLEKDLRAQGRRITVALLPVTEESARKAAEQIMLELTATP